MAASHAPSWYAATAHASPTRPAFEGSAQTEVCVIGGGFTGVAAALACAERGRSVILVEAHRIGWGASGRNGGQVLPGWSGETEFAKQLGERGVQFLDRTRYVGNERIERNIERYAIDCDYVRGAMTVANNQRQYDALIKEHDDAKVRQGANHLTLVGRDELRDRVDTRCYAGGLIDARAAHCHPLNLVLGEARAAESVGVLIFESSPVTEIVEGAPHVIRLDTGEIRASTVILAGNAYHRLAQARLGGYMLPAQTFMMATSRLNEDRVRTLIPDNLAVADANWVLDYFRRTSDNRLLFGGRCTYSNRVAGDIVGALRPRMLRVFPQLADTKIDFSWTGTIGIPLNRAPLIGRLAPNLFYAQGYSGHGVNCSHIAAEILADALDLNDADASLFEEISHFRIPAAGVIGNPMLALGMTWFRLKDALGV
jgi:glycine/D-amino acid oxidase-like deaminating enzyme